MSQRIGLDPVAGLAKLTPENTYLRVKKGAKIDVEIPLPEISSIIGRNYPPDILVQIDLTPYELGTPPMTSRQHAIVEWVNGQLRICDLNSRNGTRVNGQKLTAKDQNRPSDFVTLKLGDIITFGNIELEVVSVISYQ